MNMYKQRGTERQRERYIETARERGRCVYILVPIHTCVYIYTHVIVCTTDCLGGGWNFHCCGQAFVPDVTMPSTRCNWFANLQSATVQIARVSAIVSIVFLIVACIFSFVVVEGGEGAGGGGGIGCYWMLSDCY